MNTPVVMAIGSACAIAWIIAYIGVIRRGFLDQTFGIPVAAFAANISWEAIYGFFFEPFTDYLHNFSIAWFVIDIPIAIQIYRYGAADFAHPFIRRYWRTIFFGAIATAFPLLYFSFHEFRDPLGEYTGFGINFMMSILFVAMLLRREGVGGQSMYIALFKAIGTFLAWFATAVQATTTMEDPWPDSSFVWDVITHTEYPLTPLINLLYLFILIFDTMYIVMLYRRMKSMGIEPWRRF